MGRRKVDTTAGEDRDLWGADAVVREPRADIPEVRARHRSARRWRVLILACLVSLPLVLLSALVAVTESGDATGADQSGAQALSAPGRAEAADAVAQWLAGTPAPLPDGHVVSYDGARLIPFPQDTDTTTAQSGDADYQRWEHSFTVQVDQILDKGSGQVLTPTRWYSVSVLVAYAPAVGAKVLAPPSMIPVPASSDRITATAGIWPNTASASPTDAVTNAINAWVAAYTSGDPTAFTTAISDPNPAHSYVPLTGVVKAQWSAEAAAYELTDQEVKDDVSTSSTMIVQITLSLDRAGISAEDANTVTLPATALDLLVTGAQSGAPKVVAWGPPGTGHLLTPYGNATTAQRAGTDGQ